MSVATSDRLRSSLRHLPGVAAMVGRRAAWLAQAPRYPPALLVPQGWPT
jgi:hypothetical protein